MSVSISIIPMALLYVVVPQVIKTAVNIKNIVDTNNNTFLHLSEEITNEFLNKEFDTNFMDEETLLKTLIEHGATDIINYNGNITCNCESLHLEFSRQADSPYKVIISYYKTANINSFMDDINTEYSSNVQEISYNKIKENLEAQNLEIEDEEILEDNTIVLTVNLED